MAAGQKIIQERNQDATIYIGGLDEKVTDTVLWELFAQVGVVDSVHMPRDRVSFNHQGYGFVEFVNSEDAEYAIRIMNMIKLYGRPIRVNKVSNHLKNLDVGANIFIGNLDPEVSEKLLYDIFSAFGVALQPPKIMRDSESGNSKGFAFINYANFEAADAAILSMNGQYLCNRCISVSYAYKRDSSSRERHGSAAERLLAAQNPLTQSIVPNKLFADAPQLLLPPSSQLEAMVPVNTLVGMPISNIPMPGIPLPPPLTRVPRIPPMLQQPPPPLGMMSNPPPPPLSSVPYNPLQMPGWSPLMPPPPPPPTRLLRSLPPPPSLYNLMKCYSALYNH